jgi:hypothetical protein
MFENFFGSRNTLDQIKKQEHKQEEKRQKEFMEKIKDSDPVFMRPINQDTIEQRKNQA